MKIHIFNVGQGDHSLIEFDDSSFGIIDFHFIDGIQPEPPALTYLKHLQDMNPDRVIEISFLHVSHNDLDHLKGLNIFIQWLNKNKNVKIKNIWLSGGKDDHFWKNILIERFNNHVNSLTDNEFIEYEADFGMFNKDIENLFEYLNDWQRSAKRKFENLQDIRIVNGNISNSEVWSMGPLNHHVNNFNERTISNFVDVFLLLLRRKEVFDEKVNIPKEDRNLLSVILRLKYKSYKIIFSGDTSDKVWLDCIDHARDNNILKEEDNYFSDFIKVNHHGSKHSSSIKLWKELISNDKSSILAISAGHRYGHPHKETLDQICEACENSKSKGKPLIYATNRCTMCIENITSKKGYEELEWYHDQISKSFNKAGSDARRRNKQHPSYNSDGYSILSYTYTFTDKGIKVTTGIVPYDFENCNCTLNPSIMAS